MRRLSLTIAMASIFAITCPPPTFAGVDVHIGVAVPPPPAIVFEHEPEVVVVPNTQVYYAPNVSDYDTYRYGPYWYANRGGYWYRARSYSGPFAVVEYGAVPRPIIGLPGHYHRHPVHPPHGPHAPHEPHGHYHHDHD